MTSARRHLDELTVYGYVHDQDVIKDFPNDIINLFLKWYHIECYFLPLKGVELDNDRNVANKTGPNNDGPYDCFTIYGSIIMPSKSKKDIDYKYKIKILDPGNYWFHIAIGIDDAKCKNQHTDFCGNNETEHCGYYGGFGSIYNKIIPSAGQGKKYGEEYGKDDVISICYNPYKQTLQFEKNGVDQGIIRDIATNKDLEYRISVLLPGTACVQLL